MYLNDTYRLDPSLSTIRSTVNQKNISDDGKSIFFYNRSDYRQILVELSPWRAQLTKTIPVFYYLGLITNALCILILCQKTMINRKSIFYLAVLSFSDFMYNLLSEFPNMLIKLKLTEHDIFKTSGLF
jgi:hypothetical protein